MIHKDPTVQDKTINAVAAFLEEYFSGQNSRKFKDILWNFILLLENHLLVFLFSDDNFNHKDPTVQERAINAVPAFVEEYFSGKNSGKFDGLLQQYTSQLETSELHLRGFALALGSLPQKLLQGTWKLSIEQRFWI